MKRIRYGTTRIVFVVGRVVFKFPDPRFLWKDLSKIFSYLLQGQKAKASAFLRDNLFRFLRGIISNLTEFGYYLFLGSNATFLSPVWFSCGLFSIQRYEGEKKPTEEDLNAFWSLFSDDIHERLALVSMHDKSILDFRKVDGEVRVIDYGNRLVGHHLPLGEVLSLYGHLYSPRKTTPPK